MALLCVGASVSRASAVEGNNWSNLHDLEVIVVEHRKLLEVQRGLECHPRLLCMYRVRIASTIQNASQTHAVGDVVLKGNALVLEQEANCISTATDGEVGELECVRLTLAADTCSSTS